MLALYSGHRAGSYGAHLRKNSAWEFIFKPAFHKIRLSFFYDEVAEAASHSRISVLSSVFSSRGGCSCVFRSAIKNAFLQSGINANNESLSAPRHPRAVQAEPFS